jgi:hypothetical protein
MVGLRRPGKRSLRRRRPTPGAQRLERPISIGAEPSANGRHACRMNSASGGLRPTVGLRRPRKSFASAGPTPGAQRLKRPISIGAEPSADGWPARRMNSASGGLRPTVGLRRPGKRSLRRRRPTPGAQRLGGPISNRRRAYGRRSACADWENPSRRRRPTPGAQRLERPISIGAEPTADGRPARRMNSASGGLRPTVGMRRPGKSFASAGPTPDAQRLKRPISIGAEPSADGRPAPTGKAFFASAQADAWRVSASEGRFQSAQSLRPAVGMRRPGKSFVSAEADAWRVSA